MSYHFIMAKRLRQDNTIEVRVLLGKASSRTQTQDSQGRQPKLVDFLEKLNVLFCLAKYKELPQFPNTAWKVFNFRARHFEWMKLLPVFDFFHRKTSNCDPQPFLSEWLIPTKKMETKAELKLDIEQGKNETNPTGINCKAGILQQCSKNKRHLLSVASSPFWSN